MSRRVLLGALAVLLVLLDLGVAPSATRADTIDPAPVRSLTTAYAVNGVAVQPGTGRVFVSGDDSAIHVYAPTASGSATEMYALALGCVPWQLTFNAARTALLVPGGTVVDELDPVNGAAIHVGTGPTQARSAVYTASSGVLVADLAGNRIWRMDA